MSERVRIGEASQLLGMGKGEVRERMRRGILPIGKVITPTQSGKSTYRFYIYRDMLYRYLGKEVKREDGMA